MRRHPDEGNPGILLTAFGEAPLMQHLDGRLELLGGTETDRQAALEWLARFLPEARLGHPRPLPWARRK